MPFKYIVFSFFKKWVTELQLFARLFVLEAPVYYHIYCVPQLYYVGAIIPISNMRKLKHREVKKYASNYIASNDGSMTWFH